MTAKEWWTFAKGLRPTWQFVALSIIIGVASTNALAIWFALWVLMIVGAGMFDPRIKHAVQAELLKKRIEQEEQGRDGPPEN